MSSEIITNELVYFTGSENRVLDFSGTESCFDVEQRFEFLKHYQKAAREWSQDEKLEQKAVLEEQVTDFLSDYERAMPQVRSVINFEKMTAYTETKRQEYEGFSLYCGAKIEEGELILADRNVRPNPCVKYELSKPCKKIRVAFDVLIGKEYQCRQEKKCGQEQAGRTIELRAKTLDKVKIKIFNTGEAYSMSEKMWTPVSTFLGKVRFGEYNHIEITVDDEVTIVLNGHVSYNIKATVEGEIDNLFFDGGMHPRGTWKIKNLVINGEKVGFVKKIPAAESVEKIGEVTLPYAIGGYQNRDRNLYLTSRFTALEAENAVLTIQTLDPCGKVWINDVLVLDTEDFMQREVAIGHALKKGENEIRILVEARPPEVYYYWHRHTDCYNGWFCGRVSIAYTSHTFVERCEVRTKNVEPKVEAAVRVTLNQQCHGTVALFIRQCFPQKGEECRIGKTVICNNIAEFDFSDEYRTWSPDSPVLYAMRVVVYDEGQRELDDFVVETGFRIVEQRDGSVYLNHKKIMLKGALLMQFLSPYDEVPINHNCPSTEQIVTQGLMLKNMNGNTLRLHLLGYGTNDVRFAEICDRLGIMLIWTTRLIDSLESLVWEDEWREKEAFAEQMRVVLNNPSVIMWEGSNEYHPMTHNVIDRMYDTFTSVVKQVDDTRLICPCSHLYYGGGLYDVGGKYYNDAGTLDQNGGQSTSGYGWRDNCVVRSAHTYSLLCGYGGYWEAMRKQNWRWQNEMLESKTHAYLVSEYAVTALANPNTAEARANDYVESYERSDELRVFGRCFQQEEWRESQAYQAFCAFQAVKKMRTLQVDGMLWCCLSSGANDGSYLKPPIDFYGYKKLGFYALRDAYRDVHACSNGTEVSYGIKDNLIPMILNAGQEGSYQLTVSILNMKNEVEDKQIYEDVTVKEDMVTLEVRPFQPKWKEKGYYVVRYALRKRE